VICAQYSRNQEIQVTSFYDSPMSRVWWGILARIGESRLSCMLVCAPSYTPRIRSLRFELPNGHGSLETASHRNAWEGCVHKTQSDWTLPRTLCKGELHARARADLLTTCLQLFLFLDSFNEVGCEM
jgi:hypothetical protein